MTPAPDSILGFLGLGASHPCLEAGKLSESHACLRNAFGNKLLDLPLTCDSPQEGSRGRAAGAMTGGRALRV